MISFLPTKYQSSMFAYLINQTNPGNKRTYIFKRHFTLNNTGRSATSPWNSLPLAWVNPTEKHLWHNYQMYRIHKWMIDSVHYFSENNNCITVNAVLVYILKRTRLAPKMTTANCHVICKREKLQVTWIPSIVCRYTNFVHHYSWRNKRCRCL